MRPHVAAQAATGRSGVAAIGVAQEYASVFTGTQKEASNGIPWFAFTKADRRVTCYYFYLWDADFGPAFIKICAYFPYPAKVWLNGHEWAKRQAAQAGIGFTELSNGFAATDDPARLQDICDRLGSGAIRVFVERWLSLLPTPLTDADREAGYWWELSMRQVEVSRTIVFTQPRHARAFFEALVADNLDIGRPEQVELIFARRTRPRRGRKPADAPVHKTKVVTRGVDVTVNAFYKHSRIKQYLKDGRALRVETVINDTYDLGCQRRLPNLETLQTKARDANHRLLDTERVGQGCVLASPAFERIAHPTTTVDGRRAPALRFGDPRVQALAGALCTSLLARHRSDQPEPARLDDRTARRGLQHEPRQLRPAPAPPQRADPPRPRPHPLPTHHRRPSLRDLLHQGPQPRPTPAPCDRRAAGPTAATRRPTDHRPAGQRLLRPGSTADGGRLRL